MSFLLTITKRISDTYWATFVNLFSLPFPQIAKAFFCGYFLRISQFGLITIIIEKGSVICQTIRLWGSNNDLMWLCGTDSGIISFLLGANCVLGLMWDWLLPEWMISDVKLFKACWSLRWAMQFRLINLTFN